MKTKEAIKFMQKEIEYVTYPAFKCHKEKREVIEVLKRGEKFEKMWRELENKDLTYNNDSPVVNDEMYYIEQKYFPKEIKK